MITSGHSNMSENLSTFLAIGTRIHLGKASKAPDQKKLNQSVTSFIEFCTQIQSDSIAVIHQDRNKNIHPSTTTETLSLNQSFEVHAAIAVDSQKKIEGYDLVRSIHEAIEYAYTQLQQQQKEQNNVAARRVQIDLVEVCPWGNFIPALNALVSWGAKKSGITSSKLSSSPLLLFVSAETKLTPSTVSTLCSHMDSSTLVAGVKLEGHVHYLQEKESEIAVELNGRTTPWNTAAVWNLRKLSLIGFPLVSEGLIPNEDGSPGEGGVEETSCITILQSILPTNTAKAKLIRFKDSDVAWNQNFDDDERRKWHEHKMKSKSKRAGRHLELLGLSGTVFHL